jgi:uncharacterized LabA/DUF88 family protein
VDVGYLLAEGGKAYCGVTKRSQVHCRYADVAYALEALARAHSELPLLRAYWYDGAPDYVPTQDHLAIASLPRVKLRLGRLVTERRGVRQKGVDSLIVHDLITLAHERAVSTVYLLAGDEDIREGVAAAQRFGVQVILLGIRTRKPNQSLPLIRESDEHVFLDDNAFSLLFEPAGYRPDAEAPLASEAEADPRAAIADVAQKFAAQWAQGAGSDEAAELLAHEPRIPRELDTQLILAAEEALGLSLREKQELRHVMRAAFWAELKRAAAGVATAPRPKETDP